MSGHGAESHPGAHLGALLSAYLDGEIDRSERDTIVTHLAGCSRCREDLEDLSIVRAAVRGLPSLELPPALRPPVVPDRSVGISKPAAPLYRRWTAWAGAAATVAVMVVGGSLLAPEPVATITPEHLSVPFVARSSAEVGLTPMKVVVAVDLSAGGQP